MRAKISTLMAAASAAIVLSACGGGGTSATPAADTLSGTAAVGSPIVGGTVTVKCAGGSAPISPNTTSTGAWQVTLSGQTLPCAVQVSGGTINSVANATAYHSIAISAGTVNVTPLTDLLVANFAGSTAPGTWFTGLTPSTLTAINQSGVNAALTQLRGALPGLTPLSTVNPITTVFTPTPGNNVDDMLAALQTAIVNASSTYATLLSNAAQPTFTAPNGYSTALSNAYAGTTSGGASAIPAVPGGVSATAASSTQINVNWTNVSGASSYNVYRSTSPSVQTVVGNKINTTAVTAGPFQNTELSASTIYYYKVTATNTAGETVGSTEVSATTSAPGVITPTLTSVTPSSGTVGATVTLTGTNFSTTAASNTVNFNGVPATVTNATATQLTVTVPTTASTGNITVTVGGQTATSSTGFTVSQAGGGGGATPTPGTQLGGSIQGTALSLTGAVTTLAGGASTFMQTTLGDGTGVAAIFAFPAGITSDGTYLYVADTSQNAIRKVAIATGVVTTLAGNLHFGLTDGTGGSARFKHPAGITTDGTNVYVADTDNNAIRKIVIATGVVSTVAGNPAKTAIAGKADGVGTAAEFNRPEAITTDGTNLYVADTLNYSIRQIVIATGAVTTLAGATSAPLNGVFSNPTGITTVGGNLYVASDSMVHKVVIATGQVSTFAGTTPLGYLDGTGTAAGFAGVYGITTDGTNLYTSSAVNHNIRKIVIATGEVTTITGAPGAPFTDGFAGSGLVNGTGTAARFQQPRAITTDGVSLYVADTLNNLIRKIQ